MSDFIIWCASWLYELAFGCSHANYSWPQTVRFGPEQGTYVKCLTCGKRLEYDWPQMHVVSSWESYRSEREKEFEYGR